MSPTREDVPTYDQLLNPTLRALHSLGGSASIHELVDRIITDLNIDPEIAEVSHPNGNQTALEYRAGWARTYLKKYGLVNNSKRGVWALTERGQETTEVDPQDVVRLAQAEAAKLKAEKALVDRMEEDQEGRLDGEEDWRHTLIETLLDMDPHAFERLCQRILRESGFIEVEVTRRSGDGGIDGHGVIRIADLISFPVIFQSKRHRGTIGPDMVRDFRGAMVGRADRGLLITTGRFTREARREATRDGAPPIDLIDGDQLVEKLKELGLGVSVTPKVVEDIEVDHDWFKSI